MTAIPTTPGQRSVAFLPMAVFTAVGGVAADRKPRAWIMVLADLSRAALVLGMAFLAFADWFIGVLTSRLLGI